MVLALNGGVIVVAGALSLFLSEAEDLDDNARPAVCGLESGERHSNASPPLRARIDGQDSDVKRRPSISPAPKSFLREDLPPPTGI
jgi:hypothetical protein